MHNQQRTQNAIPKPAIGVGRTKNPVRLKPKPAAAARKTTSGTALLRSLLRVGPGAGETISMRTITLVPITENAINKNPIVEAP